MTIGEKIDRGNMADWITGTCKANGIEMHFLRTGGDKPPVILLHGLMLSGACWTPLARSLEDDYDVIMPDARGHGHSSAPHHGYSYNNLAMEVVNLIDTLKLANPVLVGHSMGGMTAAVVANLMPNKLGGLILADPTFLTPERQREVQESDVADQHRQVLARSKEKYLADARVRHKHRPLETIELFAQARFQTSIHAFEILTPPNPDYTQLISNLDIPSLLVIGDASPVISTEMARELAELNQHLEVSQIAGAGHAVPFDQPEHFATVVQTFLRRKC